MRKEIINKKADSRLDLYNNLLKIPKSKSLNSRSQSAMKLKLLPDCKRSQHEIAGFVLIVLIVSIIGVIFLSIAFNKNEVSEQSSFEISNLLGSTMYATSDCAINYIPQYRDMQDLIKECYKDKSGNFRDCLDGRDVCMVLEENLREIIESSLNVGENSPNKAYKLDIYFSPRDVSLSQENILYLENGIFGNCSSVVGGGHSIPESSLGGGTIDIRLTSCKN